MLFVYYICLFALSRATTTTIYRQQLFMPDTKSCLRCKLCHLDLCNQSSLLIWDCLYCLFCPLFILVTKFNFFCMFNMIIQTLFEHCVLGCASTVNKFQLFLIAKFLLSETIYIFRNIIPRKKESRFISQYIFNMNFGSSTCLFKCSNLLYTYKWCMIFTCTHFELKFGLILLNRIVTKHFRSL